MTDAPPGCASHPDQPVAARCAACDRALCADCWQQVVDHRPACPPCVPLLTRPIPALVPVLAAVLALVVLVRIGWVFRPIGWISWTGYGFAALLILVSAWRLTSSANTRRANRDVEARPPDATIALAGGHPYRGAFRRSARRLSPPVSGTMAGFIVASALVITAASVPALFRLPAWLELELVVAGWWLIWTVALTVLLYRGWRVAKDPS